MRRNGSMTNAAIIGGILGATASAYALSRMNVMQRRRVYRTGRNIARFANKVMDRMDNGWF
ncbi:hypothetical protein SAMN05661008_00830 [Alkalithermobacter thermoalcaliphilus JW-YL-7 = DSM 7308]|uniref:YtxH domain-containing protein n=1 Tax=Alkalithermobacter thermoalcaliphilus JW-YL-7 = DSM 7308 TaxID=1121328 RepID=A0A150FQQ7_CLOPD|nr:hypothetical protein JWYL7_1022 [[Clostridium] paradoxum JW-YL-7 = DSM 7308]SHK76088.1 hypothetical protein SAMN05661008_00830 [[Clostridium] paradoxum JW-YL-7 = DSM 7308]